MRVNSIIISSLLTFSSVFSAVINYDSDIEKYSEMNSLKVNNKKFNIDDYVPMPCLDDSKFYNEICNELNGKFYSKFHPYPDCYTDYVCFVGKMESGQRLIKDCILIDKKFYCSAYISSIECCRPKSKSYNFNQCVKEASKIFSDFRYSKGLVVSEIKEHPVSESFISGQTYSYDDNTKFKYADKH